MFHGRIYLNSVLLLLLVKFVSESSLELIHIYIPHHKYMFKPHSSPWFLAACAAAAAIVHRNHFFSLNQQIKSCECKVKFRQASNEFKWVLEAAKLLYANKTSVHHFPESRLSGLLVNC